MPLWQHKRRPAPPPIPKPRLKAEDLSRCLMDTIIRGDVTGARQIFEQAFWDKVEFRPDGHHLLQAVKRGNREMIRLVTTHGATWSVEETKIARLIIGAERWAETEPELRRAGLRTLFTEAELKDINLVTATRWAVRIVEDEETRGATGAAAIRRELDRFVGAGMAVCLMKGETEGAIQFLSISSKADGSATDPFEISPLVSTLAALGSREAEAALRFVDALRDRRLAIKPVTLLSTALLTSPRLVQELSARGLLSDVHVAKRMNMLSSWSVMQPVVDTEAGPIRLNEDYVARQHAALKDVARTLFRPDRPASKEEAETFMAMHEARLKQSPQALARMEYELATLGFFDSPAFTVKHLRHLAQTAPAGAGDLAARFNREASARVIAQAGLGKLLSRAGFEEVLAAHRFGGWRANAEDTVRIVDYLATQVKKDIVPEPVVAALKTLRNGGADFSKVDPNRYLGKKAPGLCKTLLDLGLVEANNIDLVRLAKRHGGELRLLTPRNAREYPDHAFMCQVILEAMVPEKYLPLRGKPETDYPRALIGEYVRNAAVRLKFKYVRRPPSTRFGPR